MEKNYRIKNVKELKKCFKNQKVIMNYHSENSNNFQYFEIFHEF